MGGEGREGTHDDVCEAVKELFDLFVRPDDVSYKRSAIHQRSHLEHDARPGSNRKS